MAAGPLKYPRRRLNPALREAAHVAMLERRPPGAVIAQRAGFSHQQTFSNLLHADAIPDTPLLRARFQRVAALVGFTGDVFLPETEAVAR